MKRKLVIILSALLLVVVTASLTSVVVLAKSKNEPIITTFDTLVGETQGYVEGSLNIRVYYLLSEYELGKHLIIKVWADQYGLPLPEDNPDTAINVPYGVLEFDIRYNRNVARAVQNWQDFTPEGVTQRFYVNTSGQLCNTDGSLVQLNLNPQVEAYKLSALKGMTQAQLESYIDSNVTNLSQAKDYLKKLSAVVLWLVKQSELDNMP